MPKFRVKVKLVKVYPGHIDVDADDLEDAILLVEEHGSVEEMVYNDSEFYEDMIAIKKDSRRIK